VLSITNIGSCVATYYSILVRQLHVFINIHEITFYPQLSCHKTSTKRLLQLLEHGPQNLNV